MSEFTDGLLVLKSDASKVQMALADLKHPYIFQNLNEKWSVIALDQPDELAEPWILQHSHDFPMLWFEKGDDSWGYIIFHAGEQKASLELNFALAYSFWRKIAEFLYPKRDPHTELDRDVSRQIDELVFKSDAYREEVRDQYTYTNVDEFAVFGLSLERIAELDEILQPKLQGDYEPDRVDDFKKILGIQSMSWVSYHYLKRGQDKRRL